MVELVIACYYYVKKLFFQFSHSNLLPTIETLLLDELPSWQRRKKNNKDVAQLLLNRHVDDEHTSDIALMPMIVIIIYVINPSVS